MKRPIAAIQHRDGYSELRVQIKTAGPAGLICLEEWHRILGEEHQDMGIYLYPEEVESLKAFLDTAVAALRQETKR